MKDKKLTTYQMAVTAVMAAVLCVLGPLTVPIGAVPISLANFVICLTAWLLGPKFGTLSVVIYLALGAIGIPVFSGYGAGLAKLAGPTGGYLVGYLLLAFIGGMFIEKSKGNPVVSAVGLVLGTNTQGNLLSYYTSCYNYYDPASEPGQRFTYHHGPCLACLSVSELRRRPMCTSSE